MIPSGIVQGAALAAKGRALWQGAATCRRGRSAAQAGAGVVGVDHGNGIDTQKVGFHHAVP